MTLQTKTNLSDLLNSIADRMPDASAITYKDDQVCYDEMWRLARCFASGLIRAGTQRNDRVAIYLEKRVETVTAIFGAAYAGAIFVPVNPLLKPAQVAYILNDCDVKVLITSAERWALIREDVRKCGALDFVVVVGDLSNDSGADAFGRSRLESFDALLTTEPRGAERRTIDTDIAAILYTSGSTGKPKGVVLSHRNLIVGAESVSQYLKNSSDDVILSVLPLSFDAGLSQITTAFNVGAHVVLMNYLLAGDVARICKKHRVTGITGVPPFWIQIAEQRWPAETADRIRYFANTGGRMPKATLEKLRRNFQRALPYLMYGLTEAFRSTYLPPVEVDRRPDSIGKAIPNVEILVVRADGTPCAPGEEGELVHRGPLVAKGYWNDPVRTSERFRPAPLQPPGIAADLAVYSGDMVVADKDGFLYFVGRRDDMIKTSGYRVSPAEIEEIAYATGFVRDAVALGMDDAVLGQRIMLVASPPSGRALDTEILLAAMRQKLPPYMVPSSIIDMAVIPTSPNGKFDRIHLRDLLKSP